MILPDDLTVTGNAHGSFQKILLQLCEFAETTQDFENPLSFFFVDDRECEPYVNQNIVSDPSLWQVIQADLLADTTEVYLAGTQAEVLVDQDGDDFSRHG